jgi:hypothetical protein
MAFRDGQSQAIGSCPKVRLPPRHGRSVYFWNVPTADLTILPDSSAMCSHKGQEEQSACARGLLLKFHIPKWSH